MRGTTSRHSTMKRRRETRAELRLDKRSGVFRRSRNLVASFLARVELAKSRPCEVSRELYSSMSSNLNSKKLKLN